ncbi:efflux RND transporter permease subunit [Methylocystis sp. MJC1]|uniref:efflux RND transporter permease subunit n=1 Tax=Methylocystis sp. MJC1 TaxID=2654282 RepID=UPI0013EBB89B|nr:efflux RND transporter permease subunit [Methylocystis sp. MJC1]KAF2991265.1 putative efflux pump membrane transporter TtgB [Methylocystis sp. MJC1]MBU6526196.1 efflux RND transporter permease subunit [Methylocystis sp. MJC1]UZX12650.1 efflux RND transporter permease subunit [Methylocystis sp. MJC1]
MGFNLSKWAVSRPALMLFLMLAIGVAGGYSYLRLGRAEDPSFTIKVANVTALWPGSTASEMRDQVADLCEKKLQTLPYLEKIDTYTKPGFLAMQVTFKDNTPPKEIPQLFYQLRKKLGDIKGDLPAGVQGPLVNDEYGDVDAVLYAVTGDGADYNMLDKVVEVLRQRLIETPDVVKVDVYGEQLRRIFVEFSEAKIANLGVEPQAIFDSLAKQNAVNDAGVYETSSNRVRIKVTEELKGADAIAAIPVPANGKVIRLGDIANVYAGFEDPPSFLSRYKGKPAMVVGAVMAKGGNVFKFGKAVTAAVDEVRAKVPIGIDIDQVADQPKVVEDAVGEFTRSFLEALVIVLGVSFVSLGFRTGIVVALSVPLVLAFVFTFMNLMGVDLQRISLGALIIALGLLVDDAIIAVEMMMVKMEQGYNRIKAATFAWESTAFPMLTGTLITAAGFLPVGFANSAVGEYTSSMFWVLLIALMASWLVAVMFTPFLGVKLLPDFSKTHALHDPDEIYRTPFYKRLRRLVTWAVDNRLLVIASTAGIFALSIAGMIVVQKQFFPYAERLELFFQLRLPEGSSISASSEAARQAEALIKDDPDAAFYTSYIGQGPPRFWLGLNPQLPNEAYSEIVIVSKDIAARERLKKKLDAAIANGAVPQARARVERFSYGPPTGFPVQFRIIGDDPEKVRAVAYQVRDVMATDEGVDDPHLSWNEQTPSVRLVIDQDRARLLGVTPQDISNRLRMVISGVTVTTLRDGIDQIDVVARAEPGERGDLGRLGDMVVYSRDGKPVTVSQVAKIVYEHEEPIFWRRNRNMTITVRSGVKDGVQAPDVSTRLWPKLADIRERLPQGYRMEMGGAIEESAKGNTSIFAVFPIVIFAMLTIVMFQLQNFTRVALVMMSAPLGLIGASLALNLAHAPFGFVALLGLIALSGMDMRNSIILVDQVRQDLESGANYREAIIGATVRRVRPVALTALAAILAIIPLSHSAFWGPMALTIMGGLFVATFLTVLFLPALYAFWFRKHLNEGAALAAHDDATLPADFIGEAAE